MEVIASQEGSVTVLKPMGPLIAAELNPLEQQLLLAGRNWITRIVVNLKDSAFIDSAGLELLLRCHRQFRDHGIHLKLCGLNEMNQKIFELTRLSQRFEIYADSAAAVRSFL